ncbi:FkbM family methyltransferase [Streptomyces sp. NA04227]|uniref:FkbM family methyltransferase n=1 Tax=Streptomyces sp. NA04227 TaxID=2742136 RepID=UPI0015909C5C|nr:FkbM family methyltransferase [Streptomyces sp. NA04227]QKW10882.1 FkbM family methyltransferase [Streptomyces sp. NA04227]
MSGQVPDVVVTLLRGYVRRTPGAVLKGDLVRSFLNERLRDEPRQRVVDAVLDARFAVDTRDLIQRYLYLFGVWEPHMTAWLRRRLRPGDGFVDVGANIGYYSVLASRLVGESGRVVAVEASADFHRRLLQNVRLNDCRNLRAVNAAVSDREETLKFTLASSANMGANSIVPYDGAAESVFEVDAHPLPSLLESSEIAAARVIKIDVEGAEGAVVRGLLPLLPDLRDDVEITVEVTPERMAQLGDSADELLDAMTSHGFHVYRLVNEYAAESYPRALSGPPAVPTRWRGPIEAESDLIFSRVDAEQLP